MFVTRTKILHLPWCDSHGKIIKHYGLKDEDGVRVEITPPDNLYTTPIRHWIYKVDQDILPDWYDAREVEAAVRKELPAWCETHILWNGKMTLDRPDGDYSAIVFGGHLIVKGQQGGDVGAYGSSRVTSSGQQGGYVRAHDSSRVTSSGQQGGYVRAYDSSRVTSSGQQGGYVGAHDSSRVTSSGQQGGTVGAYGGMVIEKKGGNI